MGDHLEEIINIFKILTDISRRSSPILWIYKTLLFLWEFFLYFYYFFSFLFMDNCLLFWSILDTKIDPVLQFFHQLPYSFISNIETFLEELEDKVKFGITKKFLGILNVDIELAGDIFAKVEKWWMLCDLFFGYNCVKGVLKTLKLGLFIFDIVWKHWLEETELNLTHTQIHFASKLRRNHINSFTLLIK